MTWFSRKSSYLERQNELLLAQVTESLRVSQALNVKLAEGLDRVLASKFDPPLMAKPTEQPAREPMFPDMSDLLSVDSDVEFLERTN
jgi:hypothetical protein